jgi:L-arabinokinase
LIAVYVSGHGFGHSTRVGEVLRAVRGLEPDVRLAVVTSAPESLYREAGLEPFAFRPDECDVGLAQHGALAIDYSGTVARWRALMQDWERRVAMEADWLRGLRARLVLGDVPPLAFAAAARAGVPSVALANFSWDWIFRHLARDEPALEEAAAWSAEAYAQAGRLLRLPFYGDLKAFRTIEDIPLVARRPELDREEARARLGLARPTVLLSFGGIGLRGFDPQVLAALPYLFLTTHAFTDPPANVREIDGATRERLSLTYPDLVAACDVVITKPGYGIVSDCIAGGTRIVYTERGDFPEYPILVEGMSRLVPCAYVSNGDLESGRVAPAIEDVLRRAVPPPPDLSGAGTAARRLLEIATA